VWQNKYRGAIAEAEAERLMAAAELQDEIRMTELDVVEYYARAENAGSTAALLRDSVIPLARQAVEQSESAYATGAGAFRDVIDARRALLDAELERLTAIAEFARASARLDQIAGPFQKWEQNTGALPASMRQNGGTP
jgi:outer membrane protein TolC